MIKFKKYFIIFIILALCTSIAGCGLKGFVKGIQQNIKNFGAGPRTGQGKYE